MPQDLKGKRIIVTAGGNENPLTPSDSSETVLPGKWDSPWQMQPRRRGATVYLITTIRPPYPEKYSDIQ